MRLSFLLIVMVSCFGYSQTPSWTLSANSKYFNFRKTHVSDDFKRVSQIKVGEYMTFGNFGYTNSSWIGSNAILDYSSYGDVGSLGNKNFFKPVWSPGTALIVQLDFVDGQLKGYNHKWNGLSNNVDFEDFEQIWEFGKEDSYFLSNVGIGTTTPGTYKLAVNGKIRAKEVKVETGWADYVFKEDYVLPTLEEVEKHIKEKGHLINIPSAKEVEENGIRLGEMNKLLLEKIEELTLYTVQQQKMLRQQEEKNKSLEQRLEKLEKQSN